MTLKAQQEMHVMRAITDWAAPFEVQQRTQGKFSPHCYSAVETILQRLVKQGLAKYGASQNTYRITSKGLDALANFQQDEHSSAPSAALLHSVQSHLKSLFSQASRRTLNWHRA